MTVSTPPAPEASAAATTRPYYSTAAVLTAAAALVGMLSGCAEEPTREPIAGSTSAVRVIIDDSRPMQGLVSELYMKTLNGHGRTALPYRPTDTDPTRPRFEALTAGDADVVVGCMGELLEELNPLAAAKISEEYTAALDAGEISANDGTWRETTYTALVNSLPGSLAATDPSSATACKESTPKLPQNIVPIYRKPVLNRDARLIMNKVTGTMSTEDIEELSAQMSQSGSVSEVLGPYMAAHDLQGP
ncbi:hypothetical protein C1Y63_01725 [Corynebacterium sp. 13CS0277]|uniref:hypothetical protein n=1 Tax=Corynebacterium sp. 13CS0277 TaxID=2071994 RepID=UPI000D0230C0|nr:hypothetical protein [Corynebacterium sp. 13CS0277]PRQ12300.1 hypothetical protein C1Y63_01725 [Corynebacterium sp. 13CS0277]